MWFKKNKMKQLLYLFICIINLPFSALSQTAPQGFYLDDWKPKSIEIVKIGGRWGSCSSERKITYHYLISTLPLELIDYIVVHELCHLFHMNHDRSFWRKVGSIMPDYKKRQEALHKIGGDE